MRRILLTLTVVAVIAPAGQAGESSTQYRLKHSTDVLRFFDNHRWLIAPNKNKCSAVPWARSCRIARDLVAEHSTRRTKLKREMWYTLPATKDWQTAVQIAQRLYPGTANWMLAISDREGGWSTWVWYGGREWNGYHVGDDFLGADTVGGWMQFRFSTFAPYWRAAQADIKRRGYHLPQFPNRGGPAIYQAWLDPLGQALTAGYMRYYGKDGCHWCL